MSVPWFPCRRQGVALSPENGEPSPFNVAVFIVMGAPTTGYGYGTLWYEMVFEGTVPLHIYCPNIMALIRRDPFKFRPSYCTDKVCWLDSPK